MKKTILSLIALSFTFLMEAQTSLKDISGDMNKSIVSIYLMLEYVYIAICIIGIVYTTISLSASVGGSDTRKIRTERTFLFFFLANTISVILSYLWISKINMIPNIISVSVMTLLIELYRVHKK